MKPTAFTIGDRLFAALVPGMYEVRCCPGFDATIPYIYEVKVCGLIWDSIMQEWKYEAYTPVWTFRIYEEHLCKTQEEAERVMGKAIYPATGGKK